MFTSTVGKTFLEEYNLRNGKNYSAREFFDEVLFKLVFDHKKYLMWAQNSPFVQGISKKKPFFGPEERPAKLVKFHEKVERGERDASIAIGYPASETKEYATTSGLVTDIEFPVTEEEVYFSWIGGSLSLGVAGGYALLFDNPAITYATFEGWQIYRRYLNDPVLEKLRPNQITTWNGQWLAYKFGRWFRDDFDFSALEREKIFSISEDKIEVNTVDWPRLFFSLSNRFPSESLTAYVFALGQTNKTVGFVPFQLKNGRRLHEIYQQLFGEENYRTNQADFEALYGKHIKRACELGNIGLQALEPKNLSKYFANDSNLKLTKPAIQQKKGESEESFEKRKAGIIKKDEENVITFRTYKTWLTAMISKNKNEISDYTRDIAAALVKYREGARKRDRTNLLEKKLFATRRKTDFLEALIEIVKDDSVEMEIVEKIKSLRDRVHFMSQEDFAYFVLLLKFDYAYAERIS
ncbi:MAG: hypothetical protein H6560_20230 [Lewinellaceae bacterium]|nr:hypothetical protein [Lewinellaceae bacterium]